MLTDKLGELADQILLNTNVFFAGMVIGALILFPFVLVFGMIMGDIFL